MNRCDAPGYRTSCVSTPSSRRATCHCSACPTGHRRSASPCSSERRRAHVGHPGDRVARREVPPGGGLESPLVIGQPVPVVRGPGHAAQVADAAARHGGREAPVPACQVAGHVPAVGVPGHGEPGRVRDALGDERVERLEEVERVADAPGAGGRGVERFTVPVDCPRVHDEHGPPALGEHLMVQVRRVGGTVPRVVRPAVDVEQHGPGAGRIRVADQPALYGAAVGDRELPLLAKVELDVLPAGTVLASTVLAVAPCWLVPCR